MTKNKSKPLVLLGTAMLLGTMSYTQSIAPQSVNSGGTIMIQTNGSLTFTVGELVVLNLSDSEGNTLRGGFTTGATLTIVSIQEIDAAVLDVNLFPNPTFNLVNIRINYSILDQFIVSITDLQGKEVNSGKYAGISNTIGINMTAYAPGTYILTIKNNTNQLLGTYKFIKH